MVKQELTNRFQRDLESGAIVTDGKIPTFRELATRYGSSAATIKRLVDSYELRGVLRTVRGSGTYVIGYRENSRRLHRRQIGFIMLNDQMNSELEKLKGEYLKQGWVFTIYNASSDQQNPELEKNFLMLVSQQDFDAIILEASPLQPVNSALFRQLRTQGIKVVHLSPYQHDMSSETSFIPDFYASGQVAAAKFALAGYREVFFYSGLLSSPFVQIAHDGLAMMCRQLDVVFHESVPGESAESFLARLSAHPGHHAVFCGNTSQGNELLHLRSALHLDFGIMAMLPRLDETSSISHFDFNYEEIIRQALAFAMDFDRDAFDSVLRKFEPKLIDKHSF